MSAKSERTLGTTKGDPTIGGKKGDAAENNIGCPVPRVVVYRLGLPKYAGTVSYTQNEPRLVPSILQPLNVKKTPIERNGDRKKNGLQRVWNVAASLLEGGQIKVSLLHKSHPTYLEHFYGKSGAEASSKSLNSYIPITVVQEMTPMGLFTVFAWIFKDAKHDSEGKETDAITYDKIASSIPQDGLVAPNGRLWFNSAFATSKGSPIVNFSLKSYTMEEYSATEQEDVSFFGGVAKNVLGKENGGVKTAFVFAEFERFKPKASEYSEERSGGEEEEEGEDEEGKKVGENAPSVPSSWKGKKNFEDGNDPEESEDVYQSVPSSSGGGKNPGEEMGEEKTGSPSDRENDRTMRGGDASEEEVSDENDDYENYVPPPKAPTMEQRFLAVVYLVTIE